MPLCLNYCLSRIPQTPLNFRLKVSHRASFFSIHFLSRTHNQPPIPVTFRLVGHIGVPDQSIEALLGSIMNVFDESRVTCVPHILDDTLPAAHLFTLN